MTECTRCGSFAINPSNHGRDKTDLNLCDVCYWRKRAEAADEIKLPVYLHPPQSGKTDYVLTEADRDLVSAANDAIKIGSIGLLSMPRIREALELLVQLTIPEPKP